MESFALHKPFRRSPWPLLDNLLKQGRLAHFDYLTAAAILKHIDDESVAAFLCHLSICTRAGHLCISVDKHSVRPDPMLTWTNEEISDSFEEVHELRERIIQGAHRIPQELIDTASAPLQKNGSLFYFQKYWRHETDVAHSFKKLVQQSPAISLDLQKSATLIQQRQEARLLLPEQAVAIQTAVSKGFVMICGGPGTGKTYTAGHLIRILWDCLPEEQRAHFEIAIAAPTGKAASNLHHSLLKVSSEIPQLANLKAKTLHSLLGIKPGKESKPALLSADLIIVDECSMIDVKMMGHLLASVKCGARLIFLGDPHQLPSVEAGGIFGDFVQLGSSHTVYLKTCLRADLKEIALFARTVNEGDCEGALAYLQGNASLTLSNEDSLAKAKDYFPRSWDEITPPEKYLERFQKFRILTPFRKGQRGVDAVNAQCWQQLSKEVPCGKWRVAPIMIVKNDYKMNLFNGEVGVLFTKNHGANQPQVGDFAVFSQTGEKIPALLLPKYEFAYCLSVHKSQGSEFDHVLLLLPEGSEAFGREVLYTAVTRARASLEICASQKTLKATIQNKAERLSGLLQ